MEELNKKIRGNAAISYFMVFVSISFPFSSDPNVSHSFVKSHVKAAFILHILLIFMLFVMSYGFGESIDIFQYNLNNIVTTIFSLLLFSAMLFGMHKAHKWEKVWMLEFLSWFWISHKISETSSSYITSEEEKSILVLSHIPFYAYILYPRNKNIAHVRDIVTLNLIVTFVSISVLVMWLPSLASIIILLYTIWSAYCSIRLIISDEITTPNLSWIPSIEEKYILQKSALSYMKQALWKETFIPFHAIVETKTKQRYETEKQDLEELKKLKHSKKIEYISYFPIINLIWVFFKNTRERFHIANGLIVSLLIIVGAISFYKHTDILLFALFPICFGIWYKNRKAYRMPYLYDIYNLFAGTWKKIKNIFHTTRTLQKTQIKENIKIWENIKK